MADEKKEITNVKAMQMFFESGPYGRKLEMSEMKVLSQDERKYLGDECKKALNLK